MANYSKQTNGTTVRYKEGSKFVAADAVPQNIKDALANAPDGTQVDELGDVVDPTTESDEGSEDENLPTKPAEQDTSTADEGQGDDQSEDQQGNEEEDSDASEEDSAPVPPAAPAPAPAAPKTKDAEDAQKAADAKKSTGTSRAKKSDTYIGGMGFPARDGKTLSILSDVPHEIVKNVGGIVVPLTNEEYKNASDVDIIERLKELGKI